MKVSVVIAAWNERENVVPLTRRLLDTLGAIGVDWEILYVVEGEDGTREALEEIARDVPRLRVLYRANPSGLGAAFRRGFQAVAPDADAVVTLDADLNHQPEEIPALLDAARTTGADVVVGSRFVAGSTVTGIPLWKKALSAVMNVAMRYLWGLTARDKTSGFRVYRAEALRLLAFRNDDFAFLPELLIDANRKGLSIVEVPIRFIYRVRGKSKMGILKTSRSYVSLLRSRWDAWSLFALATLLAGFALRAAYAYPVHRYVADADSLLSGIRAFLILDGHFPVFYSGVRIGALESYVHAAMFSIFGPSREAIAVAPLASGCASLAVFLLLARRLVGRRAACFALLAFAFASPAFLLWTYMPNGYPETLLLGLLALWAAVEGRERPREIVWPALFGLASGLALWNSFQTLACVVPGAAVVLRTWWRRPGAGRALGLSIAAFALGALPLIVYNVHHPLASFNGNFASRPVSGAPELTSNARRIATVELGKLLVPGGVEPGGARANRWRAPAAAAVLALYAVAALAALRAPRLPAAVGRQPAPGLAPLWFTAALAALFYVASQAGRTPGPTTRYILFVVPLFAGCLGLLLARISLRSVALASVLGGAVALLNLSSYGLLPGRALRDDAEADAAGDTRLVAFFRRHHVEAVLGAFWSVYPVNFLSREEIAAVPVEAQADIYEYEKRLSKDAASWALFARSPSDIERLAAAVRVPGMTSMLAPRHYVFLPLSSSPPREALERLRAGRPAEPR